MTIVNPATFFVSPDNEKAFTYTPRPGSVLYHWSPYASGLSDNMERNIMFMALDETDATTILRTTLEFELSCHQKYMESVTADTPWSIRKDSVIERVEKYLSASDQWVFTKVNPNQFFKIGWADNDTL